MVSEPPHDVACRAPFTSMYLDQHGDVRACCMNERHPLGNITAASLEDIWRGAGARRLRRAMEDGDLGLGCDFCHVQVQGGRPDLAYARRFEGFAVDGPEPAWPHQLELSVTNTCNLRCVMCNGEWSSSIRSQVEHRPPLVSRYSEEFFEQLRPFLPHLDRVKFYGGEPFLASETLRVMEMLVDAGLTTRCHVTTNGTQWTPRVERILSMLPVDVSVSLDAATPETYESIRRGSSWDDVRRNLDRFCEWAERRGTWVSVTFCLMTVNWHELGDFCRLADELGVVGDVNDVFEPPSLSLYRLTVPELAPIVSALGAQDDRERGSFALSAPVWGDQLGKLRRHLEDGSARLHRLTIDPQAYWESAREVVLGRLEYAVAVARDAAAVDRAATDLASGHGAPLPTLELDAAGMVRRVAPAAPLFGIDPEAWLGRHHSELQSILARGVGPVDHIDHHVAGGTELSVIHLEGGGVVNVLATRQGVGDDATQLLQFWRPVALDAPA